METEFLLTKTFAFEAAHQLKFHDGKCARLHGHSFKLTVVIAGNVELKQHQSEEKPKANMLLDYGDISAIVAPFVESHLDHRFLNETLGTDSPTSEYIASFCFGRFYDDFIDVGAELREVRISETCTSEAIFRVI